MTISPSAKAFHLVGSMVPEVPVKDIAALLLSVYQQDAMFASVIVRLKVGAVVYLVPAVGPLMLMTGVVMSLVRTTSA